MDGLAEILQVIEEKGRKVYVTERLIDLRRLDAPNSIFILQLPDGSTAAGGRGGGLGERRIVKAYHFECAGGTCRKVSEVEEEGKLDCLELPYHATAMPILDREGKEKLVSGVVDPAFVKSYRDVLS
jgi:hypothetical protein